MYRKGFDLGRYKENGDIQCLGRIDHRKRQRCGGTALNWKK